MKTPIRVLHVVTYMGRGGLETMLMNYYRHIDRSKVQFDFLVHREFRADYDDEIDFLGGRIYRLPRLVPWSKTYQRALSAFFASHTEYKIVHVHQDCLSSVILKAAKEQGLPVRIAHSHSSSQDKNLKYPIKLFYKRLIPKYATKMFACGEQAGTWMFDGAPFEIINNAIDSKAYRYLPEIAHDIRMTLNISEEIVVIGHVGRFSNPKNHSFLLDIFSALEKKIPESRLLLVGDGELRRTMEDKAHALGIREKVIFTGIRNDVPELMQAMDVFVFPSLYEGLPVTLVEAQASGLPCLISDKVSMECKMTEAVWQIPLTASAEIWAERAVEAAKMPRKNTCEEIKVAGYDIAENAKRLQKMYGEMIES